MAASTQQSGGASGFDGLERSLAAVARLLTHRAQLTDIAERSGHDLPPASWALLEYLVADGPLRVSEIAACHGVDISSVTPRLKALESQGLVQRSTIPTDARVSLMDITPLGHRALESVHTARREIVAAALADTHPDLIEVGARLLDHLARRLGEAEPHTDRAETVQFVATGVHD